jgi:Fe2+ transport system protein A
MTKPTTLIPLMQARGGQRVRIHSLRQQPECRSRVVAMGIKISSELEVLRLGAPGGPSAGRQRLPRVSCCCRDAAHHMTVELLASA